MTLIFLHPTARQPTREPRLRGRWGVRKIVYLVPKREQHNLAWWQQWLADHWETGG